MGHPLFVPHWGDQHADDLHAFSSARPGDGLRTIDDLYKHDEYLDPDEEDIRSIKDVLAYWDVDTVSSESVGTVNADDVPVILMPFPLAALSFTTR